MDSIASLNRRRSLLRILRRRRWLVLGVTLVVTLAALGTALLQAKEYSASASLLFRDPGFDQKLFGSTFFSPTTDPDREAATNVRLVSLSEVASLTSRALGGTPSADEIEQDVKITPEGQSDVVTVTAKSESRALAARIANTFAQQFIRFRRDADRSKIKAAQTLVQSQLENVPQSDTSQRRSLESRAEELQILASLQTGNAELVQTASPPSSASAPRPVRSAVLGLIAGIILGVLAALVAERVDRRLRDTAEVEEMFNLPVLASVPRRRAMAANVSSLEMAEIEPFWMLRANLRYFNVGREVRVVAITSPSPGDGKSTTAWHLAAAAALAGSRALLIEADLRRPSMARSRGIRGPVVGLSSVLSGGDSLSDAVQQVPVGLAGTSPTESATMSVLFSGPTPPNPTDLLDSNAMNSLLADAAELYDLVIVDTPPAAVVADAVPLLVAADGVVAVIRMGSTLRGAAALLSDQLQNLDVTRLGLVINFASADSSGYSYSYNDYSGANQPPLTATS